MFDFDKVTRQHLSYLGLNLCLGIQLDEVQHAEEGTDHGLETTFTLDVNRHNFMNSKVWCWG